MALVSTFVLLTLGMSYLQSAATSLLDATRYRNEVQSLALAEGGAELMLDLLYDDYYDAAGSLLANGSAGPFNMDTAWGRIWVQASHPYLNVQYGVMVDARSYVSPHDDNVLSDGTLTWLNPGRWGLMTPAYASAPETAKRGHVYVVAKVLVNVDNLWEGALWSNNSMTFNGGVTVNPDGNGIGDQAYANGNINCNSGSADFEATAHLYATGQINNAPGSIPPANIFEDVARMSMPVIDPQYYIDNADYVHEGDLHMTGQCGVVALNAPGESGAARLASGLTRGGLTATLPGPQTVLARSVTPAVRSHGFGMITPANDAQPWSFQLTARGGNGWGSGGSGGNATPGDGIPGNNNGNGGGGSTPPPAPPPSDGGGGGGNGGFTLPVSSGIIYVNGDLDISGQYCGSYTFVVSGEVRITGGVELTDPSVDKVAILAMGDVTMAGNSNVSTALIYSQGTVHVEGNATVTGAVIAETLEALSGSFEVTYSSVWDAAHFPGFVRAQYASVSWRRAQ